MSGAQQLRAAPKRRNGGELVPLFAGNYGAAISRDYNTVTESARASARESREDQRVTESTVFQWYWYNTWFRGPPASHGGIRRVSGVRYRRIISVRSSCVPSD